MNIEEALTATGYVARREILGLKAALARENGAEGKMKALSVDIPAVGGDLYLSRQELEELLAALSEARGYPELKKLWVLALGEPRIPVTEFHVGYRSALGKLIALQLRALRAEAGGIPAAFLRLRPQGWRKQAALARATLDAVAARAKRLPRDLLPSHFVDPHGSEWEGKTVWSVSAGSIMSLARRYGPKIAAEVAIQAAVTVSRLSRRQKEPWLYSHGLHYGEAFEDFVPPRRIVHKGASAIRRWLKVARLVSPREVRRISQGDVLRLGHLKSFWIQVAWYACRDATSRRIDWGQLAWLMRGWSQPEWGPDTPTGLRHAWAWWRKFRRVPKHPLVFRLTEEQIALLKPVFKWFHWVLRLVPEDQWNEHFVRAAFNLAVTFGGRVKQLVPGDANAQVIHDLGINLRPPYAKEIADLIWRHRETDYAGAVQIANSWETLVSLGAHPGMPLRKLKELHTSLSYEEVKHAEFAAECARWGVSQWQFEGLQERWLRGLQGLTYESVPWVSVTHGEYRFYRLAKDDPRGIFLGLHTDCCQHPGGAASSSAWHGHESPDGAFVVVEYRGQVVAQSWAWRRTDDPRYAHVLVLDNIEVLGRDEERVKAVRHLYECGAREFLGCLGIREVRAGVGYTDVPLDDLPVVDPVPAPAGVYSDAGRQVLLARLGGGCCA